jgi:hypothetical protein
MRMRDEKGIDGKIVAFFAKCGASSKITRRSSTSGFIVEDMLGPEAAHVATYSVVIWPE